MLEEIIYNENGTIKDYSDESSGAKKIESGINYQLLLKRLSKRQRKIIELKLSGYLQKEIAIKLKLSERTIRREMSALRKLAV